MVMRPRFPCECGLDAQITPRELTSAEQRFEDQRREIADLIERLRVAMRDWKCDRVSDRRLSHVEDWPVLISEAQYSPEWWEG